jgi:hypothetical protein
MAGYCHIAAVVAQVAPVEPTFLAQTVKMAAAIDQSRRSDRLKETTGQWQANSRTI